MELNVEGIKCDNQSCSFETNESIQRADYKEWLNKSCPDCGQNLLTQEDYDSLVLIELVCNHPFFKFIDRAIGFICFWKKPVKYNLEMNGTGTVEISKKRDKDE